MSTHRRYAVSAHLAIAAAVAAIASTSVAWVPLTAQGTDRFNVDALNGLPLIHGELQSPRESAQAEIIAADRRLPPSPLPGDGLAQDDDWDTFSAEVTMRRHLVSSRGEITAEAPAVRYQWTRTQRARGWTSAIEITHLVAPRIRSANGQLTMAEPSSILRVEDDEDGTAPRVYDRRGRAIRLPSTEDRRVLGEPVAGSLEVPRLPQLASPELRRSAAAGREWVEAFIAPAAKAPARRAALRQRYGRSPGRLRSLDRFIRRDGRDTTEVLADAATGVAVEVNVGRDGRLVARSAVSYTTRADGALVRRAVRTEQALDNVTERAVSMMELANVRLERRGVR